MGRNDRSERVEARYLDFQKANDSVSHKPLDQEVKAFGVDSKVNNWIAQIVKGGTFRVSRGASVGLRLATLRGVSGVCLRATTRRYVCPQYR